MQCFLHPFHSFLFFPFQSLTFFPSLFPLFPFATKQRPSNAAGESEESCSSVRDRKHILVYVYSVCQKTALKTFFAIFSLRLYISVKFCEFVANLYPRIFTNFSWFILISTKMESSSLGAPIVFTISSFEFSKLNCRTWLHRQRWVASNLSNLNPLDYQVSGNDGVLSQAATEAKK